MTENREHIKQFLNALANNKYTEADEVFPKVVNSALKNIINNNKLNVLTKINAQAEKTAISALELEKMNMEPKDKIKNETT